MGAICPICSKEQEVVEFSTVKELMEHNKKYHSVTSPATPQSTKDKKVDTPTSQPKPLPKKVIVLEYKYSGDCEVCGREIDTIRVSLIEFDMMIAYCPNCKKQFKETKVVPIEKQFKTKTK